VVFTVLAVMCIGCAQEGLQQIVDNQQKMILHLKVELKKSAMANSALESTKVFWFMSFLTQVK